MCFKRLKWYFYTKFQIITPPLDNVFFPNVKVKHCFTKFTRVCRRLGVYREGVALSPLAAVGNEFTLEEHLRCPYP